MVPGIPALAAVGDAAGAGLGVDLLSPPPQAADIASVSATAATTAWPRRHPAQLVIRMLPSSAPD